MNIFWRISRFSNCIDARIPFEAIKTPPAKINGRQRRSRLERLLQKRRVTNGTVPRKNTRYKFEMWDSPPRTPSPVEYRTGARDKARNLTVPKLTLRSASLMPLKYFSAAVIAIKKYAASGLATAVRNEACDT